MPQYQYECANGHTTTQFRDVGKRNEPTICSENDCELKAQRNMIGEHQQKNPHVFETYVDHNLGPEPVKITSRKQKEKLMKKQGVKEKKSFGVKLY